MSPWIIVGIIVAVVVIWLVIENMALRHKARNLQSRNSRLQGRYQNLRKKQPKKKSIWR